MKILTGLQCAFAGAFIIVAQSAAAEDVTLRYSSQLPLTHHLNVNVFVPWFDEIARVTEGRVKVDVLPKTVGTPASQFDVVRDGMADVSFVIPGYNPGRFPLAGMGELSLLGTDDRVYAPIFNTVYNEFFAGAKEFDGVRIMAVTSAAPGNVFTVERPVASIADFSGLKLRSPGTYATELLTTMGSIPILKSSQEAFEMLSTGSIDGSLASPEAVVNMNMFDFGKNFVIVPGGLYNSPLMVVINENSWNKISEADRKAIDEISQEKLSLAIATNFWNADQKALEKMRSVEGFTVQVADEAFLAELREIVKPLEAAWAERAKAKGVEDPLAVLTEFRSRVSAADAK